MLTVIDSAATWQRAGWSAQGPAAMAGWDYVAATAPLEPGGEARLALFEWDGMRLAHPFVRRPIAAALGRVDYVSPFEFGGFFTREAGPARQRALLAAFAEAFADQARRDGAICAFARQHPLCPIADPGRDDLRAVQGQAHVIVETAHAHDAIFAAYDAKRRNKVRQGRRNGLAWRSAAIDDAWLAAFVRLYHANLRRLDARPFYFFSAPALARLRPWLRGFEVRCADGRAAALHLYLVDGDVAFAFLCHGDEAMARLRPNDFGYDEMIRWCCENGLSRLHLGGGAPGLHAFKAGFSADRAPAVTWRWMFDAPAYRALSRPDAGTDSDGYFPLYRAA